MEEVVITGMGCVSALGNSPDILWDNLLQGKSGVATIDRFDVSTLPVKIAAAVKEFDSSEYFSNRDQSRYSKCIQYAVYSAFQAMKNAGIDPKAEDPSRSGVIIGAGIGGMQTYTDNAVMLANRGPASIRFRKRKSRVRTTTCSASSTKRTATPSRRAIRSGRSPNGSISRSRRSAA